MCYVFHCWRIFHTCIPLHLTDWGIWMAEQVLPWYAYRKRDGHYYIRSLYVVKTLLKQAETNAFEMNKWRTRSHNFQILFHKIGRDDAN